MTQSSGQRNENTTAEGVLGTVAALKCCYDSPSSGTVMGSNPFNADAVCLGQDTHIDEARCCSGRGDDLLGRLASENVPSK